MSHTVLSGKKSALERLTLPFYRYMKRRCTFLDNLSAFNYNVGYGEYIGERQRTDTRHLGSTLMETMLKEVTDFCDPSIKESWSQEAHQQVCDFTTVLPSCIHIHELTIGPFYS